MAHRCDYCKTRITGARKDKLYCSTRCRVAFNRLNVTEQQRTAVTKHAAPKGWCLEHGMELEYCKGFKHQAALIT